MIEIRNLTFQYNRNSRMIFDNLSFKLEKNSVLSVLGRNGIGKTTLIKCLISEIKDYEGEILINGLDIRKLSEIELSKKIAIVATNNQCYQNLSVADYLVMGFANKLTFFQIPDKKLYQKAYDILEDLGYGNLLNRLMFELSSGESQIVRIARAILQEPEIIVFDEPTSNLDIKNQLVVLNQISSLTEKGYTVITTTHNPGQTIELGGDVLIMTEEEVIFGKVDDVINEENLEKAYGLKVDLIKRDSRLITTFVDENNKHKLIY